VLKILHTADWQIGKLYGQFEPDDAALLADARFAAVERLAQLASVQGVDLVLVAGDVFDAQGVADRTIHRLFHCLRGYTGPWIMIPGNHDAALSESVWTRAARLGAIPPNVTVCLTPGTRLFDSLRVAVLAAPLTQRLTHTDLTAGFAASDTPSGFHRIGVAHGSVQGILAEGIDSTNPIAAGRAAEARLDYLALGDWHGCRQVDARTWYSGTPETDRFRANDSGRALIVEIASSGAEPVVTPVITGQHRWLSEAATLQVPSDIDALLARLATFGPSDVVQLLVDGQTDLAGLARLRDAIVQAQGRARSLTADTSALRVEPTADDIDALAADGYIGEVIAELRAAQGGNTGDAETARDALVLLAGLLHERRGAGGSVS
jgi:DNA repair exonuclease SbcCD nuclease subunit